MVIRRVSPTVWLSLAPRNSPLALSQRAGAGAPVLALARQVLMRLT
ncbi:MAG: hypothetical protein JNL62_17650 [Bryobacterales bacterium]|nr:hypothetical protein [Bryobacterales bacterium]